MIPPFGRITAPAPACKACDKPLRSPVAVLDRGLVLLQWTCRACGRTAVQEVGQADYARAELQDEPEREEWTAEERMMSDG